MTTIQPVCIYNKACKLSFNIHFVADTFITFQVNIIFIWKTFQVNIISNIQLCVSVIEFRTSIRVFWIFYVCSNIIVTEFRTKM